MFWKPGFERYGLETAARLLAHLPGSLWQSGKPIPLRRSRRLKSICYLGDAALVRGTAYCQRRVAGGFRSASETCWRPHPRLGQTEESEAVPKFHRNSEFGLGRRVPLCREQRAQYRAKLKLQRLPGRITGAARTWARRCWTCWAATAG